MKLILHINRQWISWKNSWQSMTSAIYIEYELSYFSTNSCSSYIYHGRAPTIYSYFTYSIYFYEGSDDSFTKYPLDSFNKFSSTISLDSSTIFIQFIYRKCYHCMKYTFDSFNKFSSTISLYILYTEKWKYCGKYYKE